ncbi:receptor-type tyrosine-protein phosphatase eta isoform X2 [Oncorhynchus keta]|uniref:receptor-type tyrosine-protein phosphatase eta isoform X2 n=1 Tax=Oncorhynchus keta TaxID=8018 RepID=UPI0015FA56CD|nr:receptor-type tyrosine-protein phosphatase eta isoform X2 [Oncorhynchus keta]
MLGAMSRMSCFGVLLRTSVVLYLFLKGSQAQCAPCTNFKASTTATEINIQVHANCTVSTGSTSVFSNSTMATLSGLAPGSTHRVHVLCNDIQQVDCCNNFTTKPETITILTVTKITTSSVSLSWNKPEGSSFYKVEWTDGSINDSQNTTGTSVNVTALTAGAQYVFTVTAVAGDNKSEGRNKTVLKYTKPAIVRKLTVSEIRTSSVSLSWTEPEGNSSFYIIVWTDGSDIGSKNTTRTSTTITGLPAGVGYTFRVTAVAGDNTTVGEGSETTTFTKPAVIATPTVIQTTTSLSLSWTKPTGEAAGYRVEFHNGGTGKDQFTSTTSAIIESLTQGTQYTLQVFAIAQDKITQGDPRTVYVYTKPGVVGNLNVIGTTTSSVYLSWTQPKGNSYFYSVEGTGVSMNTTETSTTISGLTAGVQYNFTVTTVAGDKTTVGEGNTTTTFTNPKQPVNIVATRPGTSQLNVTWTLPGGRVDQYNVNISNAALSYTSSQTTQTPMASFTGLQSGRVYEVTVTAVAGHFRNQSATGQLATVPNPPGPLNITERTTSSLAVQWKTPGLMTGVPGISYDISYYSTGTGASSQSTASLGYNLLSLSSGTFYTITVITVGAQDLGSTPVNTSGYTLPKPVVSLTASPLSTSSVKLQWTDPVGVKSYYSYRVQYSNDTGPVGEKTVNTSFADVPGLEPGTGYTFTVTTVAAAGSHGIPELTFSYTQPKAVSNLVVKDLNTTAIKLSWSQQDDHQPIYSYLVTVSKKGSMVAKVSTMVESYTFTHLQPGDSYTFSVVTVVQGVKSDSVETSSYTKPGVVTNIATTGTTTTMNVTWDAPVGQVDSYTVTIHNDNVMENSHTVSNDSLELVFQNLKPGKVYVVRVVTNSGPLTEASLNVTNATYPNPPGTQKVEDQTTGSINISWARPLDMDLGQYRFSVFYLGQHNLTEHNWILLENLQSGTLYNITVVTVGPLDYQSTAVTTANYTRPRSVSGLTEAGITPTDVTLVWDQPENKVGYSFKVEVTYPNGSLLIAVTVNNTKIIITGLQSGSNYTFTVTTLTEDGTMATPVKVSYYTRPYPISGLLAPTVNTTGVRLTWTKPPQYQSGYTYRIQTEGCVSTPTNHTVTGEEAVIPELTPGTNCTFRVSVKAQGGIEGGTVSIFQYTEPESVQPSISNKGSTNTMVVSWAAPPGNVGQYVVHLNSTDQVFTPVWLNSNQQTHTFIYLSAGREYTAVVTTISGPFNETSGPVTTATQPNPPGPIGILEKTTSSITVEWGEAPLMANTTFSYLVKYLSTQRDSKTVPTTNTSQTLPSLSSGTPYNVSVVTVGVLGFHSEEVWSSSVTTRPESVQSLHAVTAEVNLTLTWSTPVGHKPGYSYRVTWTNSTGLIISNRTTAMENLPVNGLVPGSPYNFTVTTQTDDGTEGAPVSTSSCTNASPVSNLKCASPDDPNAKLSLSWTKPKGLNQGFQITAKETIQLPQGQVHNKTIGDCNPACGHTVPDLKHYTDYTLTVTTLGCGKTSTVQSLTCKTGITVPPIPADFESLVSVTAKDHNSFSVQLTPSLLDSTNGPIKHYGVLVTSDVNNVDQSNSSQYLVMTYQDWEAGSTTAYLATVKDNTNNSRRRKRAANIDIYIGDKTSWKGYTNGQLKAKREYSYAIVLFTEMVVEQNGLLNVGSSLVMITPFNSNSLYLPQDPGVTSVVVGVTLGVFVLLSIITAGFIIYWRRQNKKDSSDIQIHSMRTVVVRVEDYEAYYKKQRADSNCGFAEEFEDLKLVGTAQAKTSALAMENKSKNRYNNVLPYDSSRVKLSIHGSPFDDYINSNYIPGYNSRKEFIAAQGPLPGTVNEFWRMIWEKNVQTLVMLTRCNEQGRVKCEEYYPSETKHFENITVTTTSEIPLEDWTIRDFDVKNVKTVETRSVRHFHFTAWPDHGVPETTELLINFRHLVREHMDQYSRHSPTVVHCSAGVGRTGTFIAIDRLIFQIERESMVDVYGTIHDLRMHRPLMVQTEEQYVFLNQCAMDIIRSRTGTNVDLIYQNTAALTIYENVEPRKDTSKNGYHNA